jgi:hypothetical protein
MKRKLIDLLAVVFLIASVAVPAGTQEGARVVADGTLWMESTPQERKAFILGAHSMMALEATYAKKRGTPAPLAGTKAAIALDQMSLDEITDRITNWYKANPGRRAMPVIGVIWKDMVEPDTAKKK